MDRNRWNYCEFILVEKIQFFFFELEYSCKERNAWIWILVAILREINWRKNIKRTKLNHWILSIWLQWKWVEHFISLLGLCISRRNFVDHIDLFWFNWDYKLHLVSVEATSRISHEIKMKIRESFGKLLAAFILLLRINNVSHFRLIKIDDVFLLESSREKIL